jgi:NADPH:quinone reductase-like Zn-dependent oxidoreductase
MESVGEQTWAHSVKSLRPGGRIVVCGATTGDAPSADLTRTFFLQLTVIGSTMGTRDELERLLRFCVDKDVRPVIQETLPLGEARRGLEAMVANEVVGKIVLIP